MRLNYNVAKDNRYEKLANGIYYGYLPKVGDKGLVIFSSRFIGDWQIKMPKGNFPKGEFWFQIWDTNSGWCWTHGLVNWSGKITQIG